MIQILHVHLVGSVLSRFMQNIPISAETIQMMWIICPRCVRISYFGEGVQNTKCLEMELYFAKVCSAMPHFFSWATVKTHLLFRAPTNGKTKNPACHTTPSRQSTMRVDESEGMHRRVRAAASFCFSLAAQLRSYELGQPRIGNRFAGCSATAFARQDLKIGSTDPGTIVYMLVFKCLESESMSPIYLNIQKQLFFADFLTTISI